MEEANWKRKTGRGKLEEKNWKRKIGRDLIEFESLKMGSRKKGIGFQALKYFLKVVSWGLLCHSEIGGVFFLKKESGNI